MCTNGTATTAIDATSTATTTLASAEQHSNNFRYNPSTSPAAQLATRSSVSPCHSMLRPWPIAAPCQQQSFIGQCRMLAARASVRSFGWYRPALGLLPYVQQSLTQTMALGLLTREVPLRTSLRAAMLNRPTTKWGWLKMIFRCKGLRGTLLVLRYAVANAEVPYELRCTGILQPAVEHAWLCCASTIAQVVQVDPSRRP